MMTARTSTAAAVPVGGRWVIEVDQVDDDGNAVTVAPTVLVTPPAGAAVPVTAESVDVGVYRAVYVVADAGRHVATVTSTDAGTVAFAAYAVGVTTGAGMPTPDDVATYLGGAASSWSTEELTDALDVEAAAQRDVCIVPAAYPAALRGALLRRVARHLAMRRLPLAVAGAESDAGPTALPGVDPEIRRLERPHRRMTIG